jgi:S-adenosylmethionine decarboxylase
METLGHHVIAELDGCDPMLLNDPSRIRRIMREAADEAGAHALSDEIFEFPGGGVSGIVLLAESHISIHTWPEHRYAAVDIYTCGSRALPDVACDQLARGLRATRVRSTHFDRGLPTPEGGHDHRLTHSRTGTTTLGIVPRTRTA